MSGVIGAQGQEAAQAKEPYESRIFDVRALLLDVPDYRAIISDLRSDDLYSDDPLGLRAERQSMMMRPPKEEPPPEPEEDPAETLLRLLQAVLRDPFEAGPAELHIYAGQLIATGPTEDLARVERLVETLKASRTARVTVHAYFVLVPVAAEVAGPVEALLTSGPVTPEMFSKRLLELEGQQVVRAVLSGFDGQRVYNSAGEQRNVVIGFGGIVATGAVATPPNVRQVTDGLTLEVQPVLDLERSLCLLDLRASLAEVVGEGGALPGRSRHSDEMDSDDDAARVAVGADEVATPPYRVAHFATSAAIPLDRISLVSATRFHDGTHNVLLFVMPKAW